MNNIEKQEKVERVKYTSLEKINTILLALLTTAMSIGSFQMASYNAKYTRTEVNQASMQQQINYIINDQIKLNERIIIIERAQAVLPKNDYKILNN